jgi:hypothetical protein
MFARTLFVLAALTGITRADTRGTLRFGVVPLELRSSSDTPLFGDRVDRVVSDYNAAAAAYDLMHGGMTARIDAADLGVTETLLVLSPGLEIGSGAYFFRLEAPLGFADELKSYGLGVYPLNLQIAPRRSFVLYASAGGTASWLDRPGSGDVGGLLALRAAVGCRFASHLVLEIGYSAFAIGGTINNERLASMMDGDTTQLAQPQEVLSAGEARGLVDASLGVTF